MEDLQYKSNIRVAAVLGPFMWIQTQTLHAGSSNPNLHPKFSPCHATLPLCENRNVATHLKLGPFTSCRLRSRSMNRFPQEIGLKFREAATAAEATVRVFCA